MLSMNLIEVSFRARYRHRTLAREQKASEASAAEKRLLTSALASEVPFTVSLAMSSGGQLR
jgi:hypothetical protein